MSKPRPVDKGIVVTTQDQARLAQVIDRATRAVPHERFPSIDELAVSLRSAARLPEVPSCRTAPDATWSDEDGKFTDDILDMVTGLDSQMEITYLQ